MMKRYKLIGVTDYAKKHLSEEDLGDLISMIDCEIVESEHKSTVDGGTLFIMPDGVETHIEFLNIEEIEELKLMKDEKRTNPK